jgi:TRAP-type C4-dicarboxylate transport system permease small subunit
MVSLAFMGGAIAYRNKDLIPLDLVTGMLPEKAKNVLDFILEIVCVVITGTLFYYSLRTIMQPYVYKQISIGLPISMAIPFASMPLSFGCMLLFAVEHFIGFFKKDKEVK